MFYTNNFIHERGIFRELATHCDDVGGLTDVSYCFIVDEQDITS